MSLRIYISHVLVFLMLLVASGTALLWADTVSWPVSVAIPTGIAGEIQAKPVCVALSTAIAGGVYEAYPISVALNPTNVDPDLVGLWHMDSDWNDASGNELHGVAINGAALSTNAKIGNGAGNFDGSDDYLRIGNLYGKFPQNVFTIATWVKLNDTGNGGRKSFAGGQGTSKDFSIGLNNNQFVAFVGDGTQLYYANSDTVPTVGEWYFVVGTFDGATISIYVNGQFKKQTSARWVQASSGADFWIGGESCCSGSRVNGLIDEVTVYKRALTAEEIAFKYASGVVDPTALAAPVLATVPGVVGNSSINLSGTRPANTSIWVNGKKVAAAGVDLSWQGSYSPLQPGHNQLEVVALDDQNRSSAVVTAKVFYDNVPPMIESSIPANNSDTVKAVPSISITLFDADSGINQLATINTATVKNATGQLITGSWNSVGSRSIVFIPTSPFSGDTYTVSLQAVDAVGNKAAVQQIVFSTIDKTVPVTKLTLSGTKDSAGWYSTPVTVTLTATDGDNGAGIEKTEYSLNGGDTWQTYTAPFVVDQDGKHTLSYRSTDKAGLIETIQSQAINFNLTGLVGWWKMDGDWKDSSLMGNDGTAYNGAVFSAEAKIGINAGSFDGADDYTSVSNKSPLNFGSGNFSISFWVNAKNSLTANKEYGLVNKNSTFEKSQGWGFELSSWGATPGTANVQMYITGQQTWGNTSAGNTISLDTWHHVVGVREGSTLNLYVDGVLKKTLTHVDIATNVDNSEPLQFAKHSWGPNLNGLLDDVRIYNHALSSTEVMEQYRNISVGVPVVNPVASPVNTPVITLSGTKPANSSVIISRGSEGVEVAPQSDAVAFAGTTWQTEYTLVSGLNNLSITSKDSDGYHSQPATVTVALDDTAPTVSAAVPANLASLNLPVSSISLTITDAYRAVDPVASLVTATVRNGGGSDIPGSWTNTVDGLSATLVFTPATILTEGIYTITLQPADTFGNKGSYSHSFTVDTTPPALPGFDPLVLINSTARTITGTKSSDTVRIIISGATVNSINYPGATSWSAVVSGLKEGSNNLTAQAEDAAGNRSQASALILTVDTSPTAAPTVQPPGSPTKQQSIVLTGSKVSGSTLYINNTLTTVALNDTTWSQSVNLTEGSNTFNLYLRDEAGNQSPSVTVNVVRDTTGPVLASSSPTANALAATVNTITVSFADGAAGSGIDLAGSAIGAVVKSASGTMIDGAWAVSGSTLIFTPSASLAEGSYTVTLYPVDLLGNKGYASFTFSVDRAQPTVASVAMSQPGPHKAETIIFTLNFNKTMDTTLQPQVSIIRPGSPEIAYSLNGSWQVDKKSWQSSYTFSASTGDGTYDLKITGAKDAVGNPMNDYRSTGLFVLKTGAPAAATISAVTSPTKLVTQQLSGTKPAGTALIINNVLRVSLNQDTTWSFAYPLSEGTNSLTIVARDDAGNDSAAIVPAPVIVLDTTPPTFSIDSYKTPASTATQTISGKKEAGCIVKMNGVVIADASDQTTTWSQQIDLTSSNGFSKRFDFVVTDQMGNTTTKSLDLLYDSSPPIALAAGLLTSDGNSKGTEVKLAWTSFVEPSDIGYYRIYMATAPFTNTTGLTPLVTVNKGVKSYTATGLITGTSYWFAVVPVDAGGNAEATVTAVKGVPLDGLAPEDVTSLTAWAGYSASDGNTVTLSWTGSKNSDGDLSEQLLYVDDGKGYGTALLLGKTALGYTVKGLVDATAYKLKITTKDSGGHESAGSVIQAVTRLANPVGVTATPGSAKATITWTAVPSPHVKSYNIYRSKSADPRSDVASMTLVKNQTTTSYTDTGLTNGTVYQYAVTTVNSSGAERSNVTSVAVTPQGDTTGPVLSGLSLTANKVITGPIAITIQASDAESAVDRIELYLDGTKVATVSGASLSWNWNIADTTDGNHTIKLIAYDQSGNATETSIPVVVSLAAPPAPVITSSFSSMITQKSVTINGTVQAGATVSLRVNGVVVAQQTAAGPSFSFANVTLLEGDNLLAVKAANRGGESPFCTDLKIIVDTSAPQAVGSLAVKQLAAGALQFSWAAPAGKTPSGYNLYESTSSFTATTGNGVRKTNSAPISYLLNEYIPADDTLHYYAVTSLDTAGNEGPLSSLVSIASDRALPSVAQIGFSTGGSTPADNTFGPGPLSISLTVSEPLKELPFLSLEPAVGSPVVITLQKIDDTHYSAVITLDASAPHGPTTWKFSGKDAAGNRGNSQGSGPILDLRGPVASITAPLTLLKTTVGPVAVSLTLDEPSISTPVVSLNGPSGSSAQVTGLTSSDNIRWSGSLEPAALAEGPGRFTLSGTRDRFNNQGATVSSGATITIYKTVPPSASVPGSLTAKGLKGGEVKLAWLVVTDAKGYRIYRKGPNDSAAQQISSISSGATITFSDTVPADGSYAYSISSIGVLDVESAQSDPVSVTTDSTPPLAPTGITLAMTGNGVKAEWQNGAGEAAPYYRLYRSTDPISTITVLTPVATVKLLVAYDPSPDATKRYYAVTAMDELGNESAPVAAAAFDFPVMPIRNLLLTRIDDGKPVLTWEAAESATQGYYIYRNGSRITDTPTSSTSFSDSYYSGGTVTYGISSINAQGIEGPVREVALPQLALGLKPGTALRRGLLEKVIITAAQPTGSPNNLTIDSIAVKIGTLPESSETGPFVIQADNVLEIDKVAATDATAINQTAVITTALIIPRPGVTVKLTRNLLAGVVASGGPLELFNEPLVRATSAKVRVKLSNPGSVRTDYLTSENGAATAQIKVLLKDQDGNILAQGMLNQRAGSQIVDSGGYATARVEPGQSFLSDPISFTVPATVPYRVMLEAQVAGSWYHYGLPDQVAAPGFSQSVEATIADVSYRATAKTDKAVYKQGEVVLISGTVVSTADSKPVANVSVKIGISVKGFDRFVTVNSDSAGLFSYSFSPATNEAGSYSLWATHPDLSDRTVQAQFSIMGLQISPQQATIRLLKGQGYDIPVTLTNLGGSPLTGLVFGTSASSGLSATVPVPGGETLVAGETRTIKFHVTAEQNAPASGYASLDISTTEGLTGRLDAAVTTVTAIPLITTSPSYIDTGLVRGSQRIESFTIKNTGVETLLNPRIEGPSLAWLGLTVDKNIGDIAAGQSRTIGILIRPGEALTQGVYNDRLVIYSDNHIPYTYNLQFTVTSSAVGNVMFDVLDELMKDVAGAAITLQHQSLPELYYTLKTGNDGTVSQFDIPEGRYSFNISAAGRKSYSGSFVIVPGTTTSVPVALEVNLVSVEWSVTPVVIEDRYEVKISQTFETNVPTPVLVAEPAGVSLPILTPGQVYNGEFKITNYGLIAVSDVQIEFPKNILDYDIEILDRIPDRIEAMQSIRIAYRITKRTTLTYSPSIFLEVLGYGGSCVESLPTFKVMGRCIICPNTPAERTILKWVNYMISLFKTCPDNVVQTNTSPPVTPYSGGGSGTGYTQGTDGVSIGNGYSSLTPFGDSCITPLPPCTGPYCAGPGGTGPEGTGPPGTGPEGTGPEGTGPPGTGPEGTGPPGTGPEGTGPEGTGPEGTGPEGTGPEGTGPEGTGTGTGTGPGGTPPC